MLILVHPDKNQEDSERKKAGLEVKSPIVANNLKKNRNDKLSIQFLTVINKAWKALEIEKIRAKCMDVIEKAKA